MKLINIAGHASFKPEIQQSYRRSTFLALALNTFAEGRVKRVAGSLGDSAGSCSCLVGLFTDNRWVRENRSTTGALGTADVYKLPAAAFPDEARALGRDFIQDCIALNDTNSNWFGNGELKAQGKRALSRIIEKYEMGGISQVTGLAKFAA